MRILPLLVCAVLAGGANAAEKPATEAQARYYIYSALLTQAAPGIVADDVALGPELSKLPRGGAKTYAALVAMTDGKRLEVRKASAEQIRAYGPRPGLHEAQPLYAVDAGELKLLVQYDLQANVISFVGERSTPWSAPQVMVASAAAGASMRSTVHFSWTGLFAFDSATLTAEARAALDREILPRLGTSDVLSVEISGHADRIGSADYNRELSQRRAAAVAAYLAEHGLDPAKMGRVGFGDTQPVKPCAAGLAPRELIACLAPNRRVVVELAAIPR